MSTLVFKKGVLISGLRPEMLIGLHVVSQVFADVASDCTVIGGCTADDGLLLEFRAHHLPKNKRDDLVAMARGRLPRGFNVVLDSAALNLRLTYDQEE